MFNPHHSCQLFDLEGVPYGKPLDCIWEIVFWTKQLKLGIIGENVGFFANPQLIKLYRGPTLEEYEEMI